MTTEMLKQLSLSVFGLVLGVAVLAANAQPAMADRGKARWLDSTPQYAGDAQKAKRNSASSQKRVAKRKFDPKLDTETEAVWRNLRPEWFAD